ncbi:hypothetical protein CIRG_00911 [Coccidioides immitis RMSCC 2394]|uniref:Uncharacterized protein n=1 Tax=Coccidioides immitis RMSCC 2394 TaxID=404692 RepID=A0A0J6Y193_COCIT|nr:hypothetical protein CIRG_00911 [Coccidioides immitis RMSCC 2394]
MSSFPATSPLHELGPHPVSSPSCYPSGQAAMGYHTNERWLASRVDVRVQGGQGRRPLPVVEFEHRRRMIWVMSRVSGNAILCVLHPSSARIPESFSYSQRSVAMLRVRRSLYCSECKGESYACIKTMVTPVGVQSTTSLSTESDFSRQRWLKR